MKLRKVRALLDHKKFAEELKKLGKTLAYSFSQAFGVPIEYLLVVVDDK